MWIKADGGIYYNLEQAISLAVENWDTAKLGPTTNAKTGEPMAEYQPYAVVGLFGKERVRLFFFAEEDAAHAKIEEIIRGA